MDANSLTRAIERLSNLLAELGWAGQQTQAGVFHIDFGPPHVPIATGLAAIIQGTSQFVLYLNFGFLISPGRLDEVLRYTTRANWDLIVGNFELDLEDGHLRFKSSLDFDGAELSECLLRNAILGAMSAVEAHAGALMKFAIS